MIINFLKKKEFLKKDQFIFYFLGKNYPSLLFEFLCNYLKKDIRDISIKILNRENIHYLFRSPVL